MGPSRKVSDARQPSCSAPLQVLSQPSLRHTCTDSRMTPSHPHHLLRKLLRHQVLYLRTFRSHILWDFWTDPLVAHLGLTEQPTNACPFTIQGGIFPDEKRDEMHIWTGFSGLPQGTWKSQRVTSLLRLFVFRKTMVIDRSVSPVLQVFHARVEITSFEMALLQDLFLSWSFLATVFVSFVTAFVVCCSASWKRREFQT